MVSTSELFVVVSTDTTDLVRFPILLFASVPWVAAWEVGIFPAVCRVRCGAVTLDGPLRDVVGASLLLPTVESETYSSPRCGPCSCAGLHHAAVPGTSRCLHGAAQKTYRYCIRAKTYTRRTSGRGKD
jgi:hypothetical protein